MSKEIKALTVRLPIEEMEILQAYCDRVSRSQTDVIREFIRTLKDKQ